MINKAKYSPMIVKINILNNGMENRPTSQPYMISETLCDFRSLYDFSYYPLPDFWVYTFRFSIVTKILQNNSK